MNLLENVEHVLEAVADLRDLRNKLAAIDEERRLIEERIRVRLAEIAGAADGGNGNSMAVQPSVAVPPPQPAARVRAAGMTARVLESVNRAAGSSVTPLEIATSWGQTDEGTLNSIRAALSRLTSDSKIRKVAYGRYTSLATAVGGASAA